MLVGSSSSGVDGVSRAAKDADFALKLDGPRIGEIAARLGDEFKLESQILFESTTGNM